ncbi:MAG: UvrB/UvrC motif-containing protein, partial [Flavobacteriales bacterium]
ITPKPIVKSMEGSLDRSAIGGSSKNEEKNYYTEPETNAYAADPVVDYMDKKQLQQAIEQTKKKMKKAAQNMQYMEAAALRDEMYALQEKLEKQKED